MVTPKHRQAASRFAMVLRQRAKHDDSQSVRELSRATLHFLAGVDLIDAKEADLGQ